MQPEVESEVFNDNDFHFCLSLSLSVLIISVFDCIIVVLNVVSNGAKNVIGV